jgi:hypothetical protein
MTLLDNIIVAIVTMFGEMLKEQRKAALLLRIRNLNDMKMLAFTANGMFYGSTERARILIDAAIAAFEGGDFDRCEEACAEAVVGLVDEGLKFREPFTPPEGSLIAKFGREDRRAELEQRIRNLNNAKMQPFTGMDGSTYYGATRRVLQAIDEAMSAYRADKLDLCQSACERAETHMRADRLARLQ